MYNSNLFTNRTYTNPYYMSNYNYQQMQQPIQQQPIQQQPVMPKISDLPIQEIRFLTADEIKAFIVMPNNKVMLVDKANGLAYIKSADAMGQSSSDVYSFTKLEDENSQNLKEQYVSKDDLKSFLTKDDLKDLPTREELKAYENRLDKLQTQIRLAELFTKEESKNV